jgi:hypothetical protein
MTARPGTGTGTGTGRLSTPAVLGWSDIGVSNSASSLDSGDYRAIAMLFPVKQSDCLHLFDTLNGKERKEQAWECCDRH